MNSTSNKSINTILIKIILFCGYCLQNCRVGSFTLRTCPLWRYYQYQSPIDTHGQLQQLSAGFVIDPLSSEESYCHNSSAGLLSGISNVSVNDSYSRHIDPLRAAAMVKDTGYLYRAAELDAIEMQITANEYISCVSYSLMVYINKRKLYDREDLLAALIKIINSKGRFALVLGGKSTGKSLAMKHAINNLPPQSTVFLIDLRSDGDIITGLTSVLKTKADAENRVAGIISSTAAAAVAIAVGKDVNFKDIYDSFFHDGRNVRLSDLIRELITKVGPVTFIIDEANLEFSLLPEKRTKAIESLQLFAKITKEELLANVILVSSEHSFPFRLSDLGFNMADITDYIFAGEVPPNKMLRLLREEWGVKDHLASALLEHYGGHIYDMYLKIPEILVTRDLEAIDASVYGCVIQCLKVDATLLPQMIQVLRDLVETGFSSLDDPLDPVAEVISRNNIGGVIRKQATTIGLPRSVFKTNFGIVPSRQSTRLSIASVLCNRNLL